MANDTLGSDSVRWIVDVSLQDRFPCVPLLCSLAHTELQGRALILDYTSDCLIEKSLSSIFVQELDLTTYLQFKNAKNRSNLNIMMHATSTIAWYSPRHIEPLLAWGGLVNSTVHGWNTTWQRLNVFMLVYDSDFSWLFLIWTLALFDGLQDALWRAGRPASQPFLRSSTRAGQDMMWYDLIGYMLQ